MSLKGAKIIFSCKIEAMKISLFLLTLLQLANCRLIRKDGGKFVPSPRIPLVPNAIDFYPISKPVSDETSPKVLSSNHFQPIDSNFCPFKKIFQTSFLDKIEKIQPKISFTMIWIERQNMFYNEIDQKLTRNLSKID